MNYRFGVIPLLLVLALLLVACGQPAASGPQHGDERGQLPTPTTASAPPSAVAKEPASPALSATGSEQAQSATPDTVQPPTATEQKPTATAGTAPPPTATSEPEYRWAQLLGRDDIAPIYDPQFVSADEASYADGELVLGVEIDDQAKAYPVGLLNEREMVNDELAGSLILVTW